MGLFLKWFELYQKGVGEKEGWGGGGGEGLEMGAIGGEELMKWEKMQGVEKRRSWC